MMLSVVRKLRSLKDARRFLLRRQFCLEGGRQIAWYMFLPPNKALQRTRVSVGCGPWLSVRAAEFGR